MTISEGIKMSDIHKPGGMVKTSGIYKVVKVGDGTTTFEVIRRKRTLPASAQRKGAHYELVHAATHSHKQQELGPKECH